MPNSVAWILRIANCEAIGNELCQHPRQDPLNLRLKHCEAIGNELCQHVRRVPNLLRLRDWEATHVEVLRECDSENDRILPMLLEVLAAWVEMFVGPNDAFQKLSLIFSQRVHGLRPGRVEGTSFHNVAKLETKDVRRS